MNKITINASRSYEVITGSGLLHQSGQLIREALSEKVNKVCIVTDDIVSPLYRQTVKESLQKADFEVVSFVFPHGEAYKSMATVSRLLEFLADRQLTRSDALIALGGGVTGDLTGYAAASYLRGIQFVQIPTTLLAAVDSSVGGKTGVNLKAGKNLAGAFWQPSLVIFDTDTIKTLNYSQMLEGIAESIKVFFIASGHLLEDISKIDDISDPAVISMLSGRAIEIKAALVEADERDTGARQLLNFGHTIGHAIEKCSDFKISHGHAVAIGMLIVTRAAHELGWSRQDCLTPLMNLLNKFKFPLDCPYSAGELAAAALKDKKRMGDTITLVIPVVPGGCQLAPLPVDQLEAFIQKGIICE